ncbi:hypothetical protein AJ79_10217 [Helicocarpus griseus UAMH5409]|uniref:Uncharacterized protein n=1 Tax=Helicocarpus griseus UAMH5409 TaxID=1447875 RepID=A0A2B7W6M3_9EURO|nr:hypothetical protein AJ79_10217 [Helicocarpus griseus UAMH5409]
MESLQFTERETCLAAERRLKFQGAAKVDLDQIFFNPQSSQQLDHKNVDRLCRIFQEERCRSMPLAHRVPAAVSRQHLAAALQRANVSACELLTNPEPQMPHLWFPPGQLRGLHGRHRIAAGLEVLSPAHSWWVVDTYLDASVVKIDQNTVEMLQLMVPRVEARVVHGLVTSGQIFTNFHEGERDAIWQKLRMFSALVPSLYFFFEDFKCFKSWAHCLTRLFTLGKSTVRQTMDGLWTPCSDSGDTCSVQTSESTFDSRHEPAGRQFDLAYWQMWLYAMRHYPQMPRDPKRKDRLAKAQSATADECVVSDMASLARRLGFKSTQITHLVNQAPDRLIAEQALLKAQKPNRFSYDDTIFNTLVDRIVECFAVATPRDTQTPSIFIDRMVKPKSRCGHPTLGALEQDCPLLFIDHLQAAAIPNRVSTFFVSVSTPLFVSENSPIEDPSENRGDEFTVHHPQSELQGLAVAMDIDEQEPRQLDVATVSTAQSRRVQVEMEQRAAAQQPAAEAEQDRIQQEAEERAGEANRAETARLQQMAEHMDRRAREAEEKATSYAAELARVQKEADEKAAEEQVHAQRVAEQRAHRLEKTEAMARRAREAEDQLAAQAAELERLRKGATEGAVQDTGGSPMALAQLQNETLEGAAESAPENIPLSVDDDTLMAELAPLPLDNDTSITEPPRPVTQFDVSGLLARWPERAVLRDIDSMPLPRNTPHKRTPVERRRAKPAGIRKSRMQYKQRRLAANRTAKRISAVNDQFLQQSTDNRSSVSCLQIDKPSGTDAPAPPSHLQGVQSELTQARATDGPATDMLQSAAEDVAGIDEAIADHLDEMLESDAEQRTIGEHDMQERARWEREHSHIEEQMEQERALALAQLQGQVAGQTTDSVQHESNTPRAALSRPVTHFDLLSLIEGWRQRGSVLNNNEAQQPQGTNRRASTRHQQSKPAGIRKSGIRKTRMLARQAVMTNQLQGMSAEENTAAESSSHLQDAEPEAIQGSSKEAGASEVFLAALGQDNQGQASSQPLTSMSTDAEQLGPVNNPSTPERPPAEPRAAALARPEMRADGTHVRFDVPTEDAGLNQSKQTAGGSRMARNIVSRRELRPRPVTQYNFRELAESSLMDPGGDRTNVADEEVWPPTIPLPSIGTEQPEPARNNGVVTITLHIYERGQWRVDDVVSIDPSRKNALEKIVRGYKRRGMILYDMGMRAVSVSSSLRAATSDGANALLLIPKEVKDQGRLIEPPYTAAGLLRRRSKRQNNS